MFESCVILNGSQTTDPLTPLTDPFESCVILNGSQTELCNPKW